MAEEWKTIANLTLHSPSKEMVEWGEQKDVVDAGWGQYRSDRLSKVRFTEPILPKTFTWGEDAHDIAQHVNDQMQRVYEMGAKSVLVGGLSDLTYYQIHAALSDGLAVYVADTERVRDENDRFVFKFRGLRRVQPAERLFANLSAEAEE